MFECFWTLLLSIRKRKMLKNVTHYGKNNTQHFKCTTVFAPVYPISLKFFFENKSASLSIFCIICLYIYDF
jgi:hypothetical protein